MGAALEDKSVKIVDRIVDEWMSARGSNMDKDYMKRKTEGLSQDSINLVQNRVKIAIYDEWTIAKNQGDYDFESAIVGLPQEWQDKIRKDRATTEVLQEFGRGAIRAVAEVLPNR